MHMSKYFPVICLLVWKGFTLLAGSLEAVTLGTPKNQHVVNTFPTLRFKLLKSKQCKSEDFGDEVFALFNI